MHDVLINVLSVGKVFIELESEKALVQKMAWHRIGVKPLSEPMLTQFTDACMRH